MQVMTQLAFKGKCREAFEFYEKVLGCNIAVMNTFGGSDAKLPPGSTASAPDHIRFAALQAGDYAILGNDFPETECRPMQGFSIALHMKTAAEAQRGVQSCRPLCCFCCWTPLFCRNWRNGSRYF